MIEIVAYLTIRLKIIFQRSPIKVELGNLDFSNISVKGIVPMCLLSNLLRILGGDLYTQDESKKRDNAEKTRTTKP